MLCKIWSLWEQTCSGKSRGLPSQRLSTNCFVIRIRICGGRGVKVRWFDQLGQRSSLSTPSWTACMQCVPNFMRVCVQLPRAQISHPRPQQEPGKWGVPPHMLAVGKPCRPTVRCTTASEAISVVHTHKPTPCIMRAHPSPRADVIELGKHSVDQCCHKTCAPVPYCLRMLSYLSDLVHHAALLRVCAREGV